jgi:hypothetical protein
MTTTVVDSYGSINVLSTSVDTNPDNNTYSMEVNSSSIIYTSSSLGIGTTTPNSNLTVVGNVWISSDANINGNIVSTLATKKVYTYTTLPLATSVPIGTEAYISDSNSNTFLKIVGGSGNNVVPVFSNGTNWLIG